MTTCPLLSSRGALHLDRIARDCADRRLDQGTTALRLYVAERIARLLDEADQ